MRKTLVVTLTAAAAAVGLALAAGTASATSGAHFFSASGSIDGNGALVVTWDEAGLGQSLVNYTVTADASATYACINGGGNHPKASNKESSNGPLSTPTFSEQPENGRVQASSPPLGPLGSNLTCPNGQTFVLACVSYSNIVLTDTTNGVSTADRREPHIGNVARTFFNIGPPC